MHNATLGLSKQCFELKKICLTIEIAIITIIAKFVNNGLDLSYFIAGILILLFFYLLDTLTYFYQDRLRERMVNEENKLRMRHNEEVKQFTQKGNRILRSFFNVSHLIYLILIIADVIIGIYLKVF